MRGPYTLRGYFNAAEHNARTFTPDGFLRTGDLVTVRHIDGQPCLRIEGLHKDVISRGGEKINAAEVEELLLRIPGVAAVALVAIPDARLGERACAFVVPGPPGCPSLTEVRELLRAGGVAKFKWPERLETIGELPVTAVGKVSKAQLRAELARRLSSRRPHHWPRRHQAGGGMRIGTIGGQPALIGEHGYCDIAKASGGGFAADAVALLDRWEEFRGWAAESACSWPGYHTPTSSSGRPCRSHGRFSRLR